MCKQVIGLPVPRGQLTGLVEMEKSLSNLPTKSFYIHNNFDHTNICGEAQKKKSTAAITLKRGLQEPIKNVEDRRCSLQTCVRQRTPACADNRTKRSVAPA